MQSGNRMIHAKSHPLLQYFLNALNNEQHITDPNGYVMEPASCLSEYVSALVASDSQFDSQLHELPTTGLVTPKGHLVWESLPDYDYFHSTSLDAEEPHVEAYRKAAHFLKLICDNIQIELDGSSPLQLLRANEDLLTQLNVSLRRHYHLFENENSLLLQFTVFSTFVERLISSAFRTVRVVKHGDDESEVEIPNTLSELLATEELKEIFDSKVLFMITIFMGSPTGLNLRNIAWHGFIEEFGHLKESYITFLLVLYLSLCKKIIGWIQQNNCSFYWKSQFEQPELYYSQLYRPWSGPDFSVLKDIDPHQFLTNANEIIDHSFMFPPQRKSASKLMTQIFAKALRANEKEEQDMFLHYTLSLLFPQWEHLLRIAFVAVNNVPESMLTAQSRVLFSTIDILLNPLLDGDWVEENSLKESNQLGEVLGYTVTDLLIDLFTSYQGPRLRDKVAHNEVRSFNIELVYHCITVYLYMASKLSHKQVETNLFAREFEYFSGTHGNTAVFDIRTRFISDWNQYSLEPFVFDQNTIDSWPSVKECDENYSTFSKLGYSSKKLKGDLPTNRSDCVTLIEQQFFEKSKVSKQNMIEFTASELLEFLDVKLKKIELTDGLSISENYRDHFLATSQHVSNISICKKIVEEFLLPAKKLLLEKSDSLVEAINNRSARTAHRKNFATLRQIAELVNRSYQILLSQVKQIYDQMQLQDQSDPNNNDTDKKMHYSLMKLLSQTERYYSFVQEGSYGLLLCKFATYLSQP